MYAHDFDKDQKLHNYYMLHAVVGGVDMLSNTLGNGKERGLGPGIHKQW